MARITGTLGNDDLLGTDSDDLIRALAGNDRVLADRSLFDALGGNDVVYAGSGDDTVYAIGGDNRLYGEVGRDVLITADGADFIDAGPGDDPDVQAGRGNDRVFGRGGNDTLRGGEDADLIDGGDGNDRVIGGSGRDSLLGGPGADTLEGREGKDTVTAGAGADRFRLEAAEDSPTGSSRDVVLDMTGVDVIDLSSIDPSPSAEKQAFLWLGQSSIAAPLPSGTARALDLGSTVLVQANSDGDAAVDIEMELRGYSDALFRNDFML